MELWKIASLTALQAALSIHAMQLVDVSLPTAKPLFSISNDDCVSVDADAEPWSECGFQAYAMNDDGSRVLTVSSAGLVQLWDGTGRELRRINWPDQPSGASGYPTGLANIAGNLGVAVVHNNQVLVIDLVSGTTLSQQVADVMSLRNLRKLANQRIIADIYTLDWRIGAREISLPQGQLQAVEGLEDLMRVGPAPTSGPIVSSGTKDTSILTDVAGKPIAALSIRPLTCGNRSLIRPEACPVSSNGRRVLVPSNDEPDERGPNSKVRLTMYELQQIADQAPTRSN